MPRADGTAGAGALGVDMTRAGRGRVGLGGDMPGSPLAELEALLRAGEHRAVRARGTKLAPSMPEAWGLVAQACRAEGDAPAAIAAATSHVAACPSEARAWQGLGASLLMARQPTEAVVALEQAVARAPTAGALADLGLALREAGRPVDARGALDRAVEADRESRGARLGRASLSSWRGDHASALVDLEAALRAAPRDPRLLGARASALRGLGRLDEALAVLVEARGLDPQDPRLAWNEALTLLAAGRFEEGFAAYGVRRARSRQRGARLLPGISRWSGQPLSDRRLLVHAEQGFGDSLQFVRFASDLAARGAEVVVLAPARLGAMLRRVPGVSEVLARGGEPPGADFQVGMMDVPGLLGLGEADLGRAVPYLHAEAAAVDTWARRLPDADVRVGVGWQGNPDFEADHLRSPPLSAFAPLRACTSAAFVCLQQRHGREQLPRSPLPMVDIATELDRGPDGFVDTAAVLASLSLVITSDTALAHLSGAMGRPTWVVLPYAADWRWMVARTDSPWYPGMRLFRQPAPGAWTPVFEAVAAALGRVLTGEESP